MDLLLDTLTDQPQGLYDCGDYVMVIVIVMVMVMVMVLTGACLRLYALVTSLQSRHPSILAFSLSSAM